MSVLYEFAPVQGVSYAQWVEEVILAGRLRLKDPIGVVTQYLETNTYISNAPDPRPNFKSAPLILMALIERLMVKK